MPSASRGSGDFAALASALSAAGLRPMAVDPPGANGTAPPVPGTTLHDLSADLAAVMAGLSGARVHLVGHGLGNCVVRCAAADHPDLVASVTLLGCGPRHRFEPRPWRDPESVVNPCCDPTLSEDERMSHVARYFASGNDPEPWRDGWFPASDPLVEALFSTPPDPWWTAGSSAPVLLVQGGQDGIAPPPAAHALLAEIGSARARLVELDRCGHAMLPEQPERIAQLVVDFARSIESGAG